VSRPIILTEEIKQTAQQEFAELLASSKMSDGEISYSKSFKYRDDCKAVVLITPEAYNKMLTLVTEFSDEVGWHGTASRSGEGVYIIEDIFVYPQEVTGSTVTTDQFAYSEWLYELDDDTFNKIRMQGHSHVNMGVRPSGVDDKHRQQILEQLEADMFYIFMIWNKSLSVHTLIYDMQRNILFEDDDVTVQLLGDDGMDDFLADAQAKVQKKSYSSKKTTAEAKNQNGEQLGLGDDFGLPEDHPCFQCGLFEEYDWEGTHGDIKSIEKLRVL
jgi:hypothetical protein